MKRWKQKLDKAKEEQLIALDGSVRNVVQEAFEHMNKVDSEELQKDIIRILLASEKNQKEWELNQDEDGKFASRVSKLLVDESKKLEGEDKQKDSKQI